MDIAPDLYKLYAEYGIAAEKAQVLETEAGNVCLLFVALFAGTNGLDEAKKNFFKQLVQDVNRKTLGRLLEQIKKTVDFDPETVELVESALEKRNYLSHHFFRKHNFAINNENGRSEMILELKEIQSHLDKAYASLSSISSLLEQLINVGSKNTSNVIDKRANL